jgi:hypothetical protein
MQLCPRPYHSRVRRVRPAETVSDGSVAVAGEAPVAMVAHPQPAEKGEKAAQRLRWTAVAVAVAVVALMEQAQAAAVAETPRQPMATMPLALRVAREAWQALHSRLQVASQAVSLTEGLVAMEVMPRTVLPPGPRTVNPDLRAAAAVVVAVVVTTRAACAQ